MGKQPRRALSRIRDLQADGDAIAFCLDFPNALTEEESQILCFWRDQQVSLTGKQRRNLASLVVKARRVELGDIEAYLDASPSRRSWSGKPPNNKAAV